MPSYLPEVLTRIHTYDFGPIYVKYDSNKTAGEWSEANKEREDLSDIALLTVSRYRPFMQTALRVSHWIDVSSVYRH
jgi:hypothetical protein